MKEGEPGPPQRVMSTIAQGSPMRAVQMKKAQDFQFGPQQP